MHTVEALEAAIRLAEGVGYQIRYEWLGGSGGGGCELKGRKLLLLDVALGPAEQLEIMLQTLRRDPALATEPPTRAAPVASPLRKSA